MIAEVIVDVKVKNLNRPFSYSVPAEFMDVIEVGMRVKVPFGPRELMGFVIELKDEQNDLESLKPISDCLDLTPSLTKELLDLAIYMSKETSSFLINCIQAMLPAAIKAKYQKKLIKRKNLNFLLESYFEKSNECDFSLIKKEDYKEIKKAILNREIDLEYRVKDKGNVKYTTYVSANKEMNSDELKGKKQKEVILSLFSLDHPIEKTELLKHLNVSHATYKSLLEKGYLIEAFEESYREIEVSYEASSKVHSLNDLQAHAFNSIIQSIDENKEEIFLLHGVTGSGKTEVYMHVIDYCLQCGKEAIMLVPEISLTPQIVSLFKARFKDDVAVLHSGLSLGEKYDEWRRIRDQKVPVVVGARSAVFAPLTNIGIIIIDEEHESSYKQDEMPKYHAIDMAKRRAKVNHATLILGSATPSLESYARAIKNVYHLVELPTRATNMEMPKTAIVNMSEEFKTGNLSIVSKVLYDAILKRLEKKEQIILLLNRRGYDNFLMCRSCGYTFMCKNCDISLTYHKSIHRLKCHYCGYEQQIEDVCPSCKSPHVKGFGYGTQKVEEELYSLFPQAKIIRMDNDTTSNKGDHEKLLKAFKNKEADILLGTQMIAKGLDFIDVTLVGVLSADTILKLPDYKASEKTFQLVTQVSGRAGRHKEDSEVIIQTFNPSHYSLIFASQNNYKAFFNQEMKMRKLGRYTPYYFMAQVMVSDEDFQETLKEANKIVLYLKNELSQEVIILGPVVPQIKRINNRYFSQIIIKYKKEPKLKNCLENVLVTYNQKKVDVVIDMYPHFLL